MAKSALRVLEIMEHIARDERGCTHAQISRDLGIPKSSLTALMRDLESQGYVSVDPMSGRYVLGSQVLLLSQAYLKGLNIVKLGQPVVSALFRELDEFSALSIAKDDDSILVCAESSARPLAHTLQIGERVPLYCSASGKVLLAFLPEAEASAILAATRRVKHTPSTITDLNEILAELGEVRRRGVGFARGETIIGITAIAVPVLDAAGRPAAALSVALPTARLYGARENEIIAALQRYGAGLSAKLGWREPAAPAKIDA